ncbi:glycosyltransferase [Pseudonocardia spinosispora]|uniref:glycosyltransferase n=1 Tax=Pseudonocardia spinosispora TaxID=103441 RepID=UPI000416518F|nr:glycosyltransferase [Pseudonocardia spinosispora]
MTEVATPNGTATRASTPRRRTTKAATPKSGTPEAEGKPAAGNVQWDGPGSLLQRVILPRTGDPLDVRALYLDEDEGNRKRSTAESRTQLNMGAGSEISFASYFNAFPASYWRRWTVLESVELRLAVDNECRIDIYRSKADGTQIHVRGVVLGSDASGPGGVHQGRFVLDLQPFEDGGWYWFDLTTDDEPVTLLEAGWYSPVDAPGRANVGIGITTFNRPDDCAAALVALAEDPLVLESIGVINVADQGNRKVKDADAFAAAAKALGDKLRIHDQGNLGGSGGFSRGMHEVLTNSDCDQVLLMDDDIVIEPDSVLRAIAFSRFSEHPMLVGGQMLNLQARSHLHTMGEVVDRHKFKWGPAPHVEHDHDFAEYPLRDKDSKDLHRRIDVDYNGWWMCLIPRTIAEKMGLPLPLFIKWDDTEYGLRAQAAGFPTATLPGVAIWHMPWSDKDDATDWQAYFHLRNRLVVAALHSPYRRGGALIRDSLKNTLKHLMSLEYSTVALQELAMQDFAEGPSALFEQLPTALGDVRKKRGEFPDGQVLSSAKELPLPSMDRVRASRFLKPPTNPITIGATLISGLIHNIMPVETQHHSRPQLNVPAQDARWFLMARLDGATVATSDGRGVAFRKRDPKVFWTLLTTAVGNHLRLAREFPRYRRLYRDALPELTGEKRWSRVFSGS